MRGRRDRGRHVDKALKVVARIVGSHYLAFLLSREHFFSTVDLQRLALYLLLSLSPKTKQATAVFVFSLKNPPVAFMLGDERFPYKFSLVSRDREGAQFSGIITRVRSPVGTGGA